MISIGRQIWQSVSTYNDGTNLARQTEDVVLKLAGTGNDTPRADHEENHGRDFVHACNRSVVRIPRGEA
jgi:hypothetical protein